MVKVKVCGITNVRDALTAVDLGAHALGFIFAPSPRRISPSRALQVVRSLPPFIKTVGVFVNEEAAAIREIAEFCGLDAVQLHGDESPDFCRALMPLSVKAFQVQDESCLSRMKAYRGQVRGILLDAYERGRKGGTGKTFDWGLAIRASELGMPVVLSGGLGPFNVRKAVADVRPYAVDVNSGVEASPGKKDPFLLRRFMEEVRKDGRE